MKFSRIIFAFFLICFAVGLADSQTKSKDKKSDQKLVEVKANVMVLNEANQFVDDIKAEDLKVFEDGIEQKISYFDKKSSVLNLGIVVDNSGSMRYMLDEVISNGKIITTNLSPNDEAFVVRFVSSDKIEVSEEWTSDKTKLKSALDNMYVEGGQSAVIDAIYLSAEKLLEREKKDKTKKYAMVVISDGEDRDSFYKYKEMRSLFNDSNIQVLMLLYSPYDGARKPQSTLKFVDKLVFETGGLVFNLTKKRTKEEIIATLKTLMTELRSDYVINYTSTNQKRDGLPRKLLIEVADDVKGNRRQGIIRESFIVPKD